jgi:hypothetical protein
VTDPGLTFGQRAGLRARHTVLLVGAVARHAAQRRLWWFLPLILLVLVLAAVVTTTSSAVPVAVYTLF